MKKNKFRPFKINLDHELSEDRFDRKVEFCALIMDRCKNDSQLLRLIMFSDEASFCLNGSLNRHNWMMERHIQFLQKLKSLGRNTTVLPFFIEETLTTKKCLELLRNNTIQ